MSTPDISIDTSSGEDYTSIGVFDIKTTKRDGSKVNIDVKKVRNSMHGIISQARGNGKSFFNQWVQMQSRTKRPNRNHSYYDLGSSDGRYLVSVDYPFDVEKNDIGNENMRGIFYYTDRWTFERKFDAEERRLKLLVEYHKEKFDKARQSQSRYGQKMRKFDGYSSISLNKEKTLYFKYKKELETLEERHPEWLI